MLVNYNSRQCLSVADFSTQTAAPVVQAICRQSEAQYWHLEEHPDGTWVVNVNSGQCLAAPAASTDALTEINQYPCGDYPDHYWHLEGHCPFPPMTRSFSSRAVRGLTRADSWGWVLSAGSGRFGQGGGVRGLHKGCE
ncbi:Ricin-type beta-trefoil lectin domain protein [Streptomyces sp. ADI92-24]|uniref:RICIN domain-containing protein n=1 Tax=unclassified Streptomyces TaxID=2593676 RepID=UPI000F938D93|nr:MULTISPECIES: RICIN domain-containing protein [unclassified Streptomyces]ROQ72599.1 ricin-type beta-trefoil lectin protein [Streptomyces sp. CEV 2-1]RPK29136.1 Ricin-type beta-trefoil lectin domain protein [Streptomyces sp. ADI92-24]